MNNFKQKESRIKAKTHRVVILSALFFFFLFSFTFISSLPTDSDNSIDFTYPTNTSALNVNSTNKWNTNLGSLSNVNDTQFNNNAAQLDIDESWLDSFINTISNGLFNSTSWNRSGTNVILANSGDNVGIGTSTPLGLFQINGTSPRVLMTDTQGSYAFGASAGIFSIASIDTVTGANTGFKNALRIVDGFPSRTEFRINHNKANVSLTVRGDTNSDFFIVDVSTERVGIGTTTPQQELNVVGNVNITGDLYANSLFVNESDGRVRIKTPSNGNLLEINGLNPSMNLVDETNDMAWGFGSSAGTFSIQEVNVTDPSKLVGLKHQLRILPDGIGGATWEFNRRNFNVSYRFKTNLSSNSLFIRNADGFVGINTSTPKQELNVVGDLNVTGVIESENLTVNNIISKDGNITFYNSTGSEKMKMLVDGRFGVNTLFENMLDTFTVTDGMNLIHTSTEADDHAFEIDLDASGYGDVKAIDINYITGAITTGQDEEAILINFDDFLSLGGTVIGLEVITTEGLANVYGMEVGATVNPLLQLSGEFSNESSGTVKGVDRLSYFLSPSLNIAIFVADDDNITIGSPTKFEEIEFIFDTVSSGAGVSPTFEFSTGAGTWQEFNPTDGTNGMRNNGVVVWLDGDIPSWTAVGGEYLIKINRTKNTIATNPIESQIKIVTGATEFFWDRDGNVSINQITVNELTGSYSNGEAYVCVYNNGTIFAKDSACS